MNFRKTALQFAAALFLAVAALELLAIHGGVQHGALAAGVGLPATGLPQSESDGHRNLDPGASAKGHPESKLTLGKATVAQGVFRFPLEFTAAAGETVGMIRVQVLFPPGAWKFRKIEPAPGSRLKVSVKQSKGDDKQQGPSQSSQTELQATFSAGSRAIPDGLIGYLQFSGPSVEGATPEALVVRVLGTLPKETEQLLEAPPANTLSLPGEAPANPAVGCFFFSH